MKTKIINTDSHREYQRWQVGRTMRSPGSRNLLRTTQSLTIAFVFLGISLCQGQSFSEKVVKEVSFETKKVGNALIVANINGNINVTGYEGEKILLEVTRTINAKTDSRLEQGKKEIQLGFMDRADTLIFYVAGTCTAFGKNKNKEHDWGTHHGWNYNWSDCRGERCDPPYDYTLDFTLKVPYAVNLLLSTVNDGDISVAGMRAALRADNINGSITLKNITQAASASTINGDVDVEYISNPETACRFYTLNGDINAWFQKGLAANMSFESYNGDFYTNVEQLESLPVMVEKEKQENGMRYKVNGNRFKIGKGGVPLDFETFNGDVYLKERSN